MKATATIIAAASLLALNTAFAGPNDTDQVDIYWTMGLSQSQAATETATRSLRGPITHEDTYWHLGLPERMQGDRDVDTNRTVSSNPRPFGVEYPHVSGG